MGLYSLFKVIVLITNALAILHEKRFLPKIGLATGADVVPDQFGQVQQGGLKDKIATLLQAVRILLRIPLIAANVVIITLEVLLG